MCVCVCVCERERERERETERERERLRERVWARVRKMRLPSHLSKHGSNKPYQICTQSSLANNLIVSGKLQDKSAFEPST